MSDTPNLVLPEIAESQSAKYVTHNEALRILDAVVQLTVLDRDSDDPPSGPSEGDIYIVGGSPSSASDWDGHENDIAYYYNNAWSFVTPNEGWRAWVQDENKLYVFRSASAGWTPYAFVDLNDTPSTLTGSGYKQLRVNAGQTALEYTEADYDIYGFIAGQPSNSQVILRYVMVRNIGFDTNFAGSYGEAGTGAGDVGGAEFSIQLDGLEIGTMTFAQGQTSATFDTNSAFTTFSAGDVLTIVAPSSQDSTLASIGVTLKGTKI